MELLVIVVTRRFLSSTLDKFVIDFDLSFDVKIKMFKLFLVIKKASSWRDAILFTEFDMIIFLVDLGGLAAFEAYSKKSFDGVFIWKIQNYFLGISSLHCLGKYKQKNYSWCLVSIGDTDLVYYKGYLVYELAHPNSWFCDLYG